jgi:hypothetical protein
MTGSGEASETLLDGTSVSSGGAEDET